MATEKFKLQMWLTFMVCVIFLLRNTALNFLSSHLTHALGIRCLLYEMILGSEIPTSFLRSKPTFPMAGNSAGPFTNNHQLLSSARTKPEAFLQNLFFLLINFIKICVVFLLLLKQITTNLVA